MRYIVVFLALVTAHCAAMSGGARKEIWDDKYTVALNEIRQRDSDDVAQDKLRDISVARVTDDDNRIRRAFFKRVAKVEQPWQSAVRVEWKNTNFGTYSALWMIETGGHVVLFQVADGRVRREEVDVERYQALWTRLAGLDVWDLHSDADVFVDDGTVYYLSVFSHGRSHQAVFYAPPHTGVSASERGLVPDAEKFVSAIKAVFGFRNQK